jgi:hypothetical protein
MIFNSLSIWQDKNTNGTSDADELRSLDSYGITSLKLSLDNTKAVVANNTIAGYGAYQVNGRSGVFAEAYLNYL